MNRNFYCKKWIVSWPLCAETVIAESHSFKWALQVAKNFGSEELKLPWVCGCFDAQNSWYELEDCGYYCKFVICHFCWIPRAANRGIEPPHVLGKGFSFLFCWVATLSWPPFFLLQVFYILLLLFVFNEMMAILIKKKKRNVNFNPFVNASL